MPEKRTLYLHKQLLLTFGLCVLVFMISRTYEVGLLFFGQNSDLVTSEYVIAGFLNDLQASVLAAPLILLFSYPLTVLFHQTIGQKVRAHLIAVVGIVQISLITYYGATLIPLGAEVWAYSITEMTNTVVASEQISVVGLLSLVGCYGLIYWISTKAFSLEWAAPSWPKTAGLSFVFILVLFAGPAIISFGNGASITEKEQRANKLSYVVAQSFASFGMFETSVGDDNFSSDYPLMRKRSTGNVLGPFFKDFNSPPNIVFLLVESLGGEFVGSRGRWSGFAPYLDSLAQQSLYWEHGLSLSGRTFGFIPSLLGSLPFGDHGFMALGPDYPRHQSLISLLGERGYHTSFYSGYDTYFDGLRFFLESQETDFVLSKQNLGNYISGPGQSQNYWGYDDKMMLNTAVALLDTAKTFPRLEIYHTLQSHSPFTVPNPERYNRAFERRLRALDRSAETKERYRQYRSELTTLLFSDQAIEQFMRTYREFERYKNTIFIITGDHWLIPVPQPTVISRYHVPILIYSPKLKEPVHFKSVNTHANILPSLAALLDQRPPLSMPDSVHWLGGQMDTSRQFRNIHSVPLMRNKNRIADYLDGRHYLYGDELYELGNGLSLTKKTNTRIKARLRQKLNHFKSLNTYVVENDRLFPGKSVQVDQKYTFLTTYDSLFARIDALDLTIDEQFERARQHAFDGNYETARAITQRILLEAPDYHDVRILMGRTYTWQKKHQEARKYFKEVLNRDSTYYDAYNAYFDNEFWAGNYRDALDIINRGLKHHPRQKMFLERKIKVLSALGRYDEAQETYNTLRKIDPNYETLPALKEYTIQ
ncbi:MAG: sulfatase-like hydrolase/transferase [Balneolaceae bacterium]|nr:sulfatase-like hydrolase/transferase [Balneolaceae bacterium]